MLQLTDLPDDILLYIFSYLPAYVLLTLRFQCKRLYGVPSGQRITFVEAYEELWRSRYMKRPVDNFNTFPMEELEKKVNRLWRTERNLSRACPVPARHHHLHREKAEPGWPSGGNPEFLHVVKDKFLFGRIGKKLVCDTFSDQGHIGRVWTSDALPYRDSPRIRTSFYFQDQDEILLVITEGQIFYFRILDRDGINPSAPSIQYIRHHLLDQPPSDALASRSGGAHSTNGEWITFVDKSFQVWLHNARSNKTWELETPVNETNALWTPQSGPFFAGDGLLFCLWSDDALFWANRERMNTLAVYLLPVDDCLEADNGMLAIHSSGQVKGNIFHVGPILTEDVPSAEIFKKLSQDDSCDVVFKFLARNSETHLGDIGILTARFATDVLSSSLGIHTQLVMFPLSSHLRHRFWYPGWFEHTFVQTRFSLPHTEHLCIFTVNIPKLLDLIDPNSPNWNFLDEDISDLLLIRDLHPELVKVWPAIDVLPENAWRSDPVLDISNGRVIISARDGIHVIDY